MGCYYARDAPETPAAAVLTEDEREVIGVVVRAERLRSPGQPGRPFAPDIRSWVVLLAGNCRSRPRVVMESGY